MLQQACHVCQDPAVSDLRYMRHARCSGKRLNGCRQRRSKNAMFERMRLQLGIPTSGRLAVSNTAFSRKPRIEHDCYEHYQVPVADAATVARHGIKTQTFIEPHRYYSSSSPCPEFRHYANKGRNQVNSSDGNGIFTSPQYPSALVPYATNPRKRNFPAAQAPCMPRLGTIEDEPRFLSDVYPVYKSLSMCEVSENDGPYHLHSGLDNQGGSYVLGNDSFDVSSCAPRTSDITEAFQYARTPAKAKFSNFASGKLPLYDQNSLRMLMRTYSPHELSQLSDADGSEEHAREMNDGTIDLISCKGDENTLAPGFDHAMNVNEEPVMRRPKFLDSSPPLMPSRLADASMPRTCKAYPDIVDEQRPDRYDTYQVKSEPAYAPDPMQHFSKLFKP